MNVKRYVMIILVVALAAFTFWHLTTAGSDYNKLTTSDSGFFFGIARQMNDSDGMIEKYELSHPPDGTSVSKKNQLQPLMLVMMYRGLNEIDSSFSLLDASMYFSPIIFILALIGIFLAGREIAGDAGGFVASVLLIVNVQLIYWVKMGALDREPTQIMFITWSIFLFTKLFKSQERNELLKYGTLSGIVFGLFLISWSGAMFLGPVLILALLFVFLFRLPSHFTSLEELEKTFYGVIRENTNLILGIGLVFVLSTVVSVVLGGYRADFWLDLFDRVLGFLGVGGGGGGLSTPLIASEQQPPDNFIAVLRRNLFADRFLFAGTFVFAVCGVLKTIWKRKSHHLFILALFLTVAAMSTDQARFFRLMWPVWPLMAALGLSFFADVGDRILNSSYFVVSDWYSKLRQPVAIALVSAILITPFFYNARENVSDTTISQTYVYPHGSSLRESVYMDIVDSFDWLRENSPENSTVAIEWSYGHFLTGYANRRSVCDGAQTTDVWNDKTSPPPGIVQRDVNGDGKITKEDDTDGDGKWERTGEGRRKQIQNLQYSDENEFASIVENLADSNLKIDYMVFDLRREDYAMYSNMENVLNPDNYRPVGGNSVEYEFDNKTVVYGGQSASLRFDNTSRPINLFIQYLERSGNRERVVDLRSVGDYNPSEKAPYILTLFYKYRGYKQQGLYQVEQNIPLVRFGKVNVPVMSKVLHDYDVPPFLEVEHMSPNQNFAVAKINHENLG